MHIAPKGCRPPHSNEPVQFWIGFGLVLIGGSGMNPLGLLTPHWIIQLVIVSFVYVIVTNHVQGKFAVGQGKHREFENAI